MRGGQDPVVEDVDALIVQERQESLQARPGIPHQLQRHLPDLQQYLRRGTPVGGQLDHAGQHLLLEASHAHHEELGENGAEDGEEPRPLEKRITLVLRLLEHPAEEG